MRRAVTALAFLCVTVVGPNRSAAEDSVTSTPTPLRVTRVSQAPRIDGALGDDAWHGAVFVGGFSQRGPSPFAPAPGATEAAIATDDRTLFVAFRCEGLAAADLSRRDELNPETDYVMVYVDGALDRRNARLFAVTAAGVQADGTVSFDSPERDHSWNALWRSAVQRRGDRWTAELAIPLGLLGLSRDEPRIGIHLRRYFGRGAITAERDPVPHTSSTYVSHFEVVGPLRGVEARRSVAIRPFVRLDLRPRVADGAPLRHDLLRLASGGDLRVALGGDLGLYFAVLPDFGETEIDPAVLNLTAYETVYTEQRQVFLEEADLFRFPEMTTNNQSRPFQLVYSRRIGSRPTAPELGDGEALVEMDDVAPVEAVARLAGQARPGTEVGVLAAMTGRADAVIRSQDGAERRVEVAGRSYFAAGRLRQALGRSRSTLGALLTASGEVDGSTSGEYALAMDLDLQPSRGSHRVVALGALSFGDDGGAPGWSAHLSAGRMGGEGFRWRLVALAISDDFDVNRLGWLRRSDVLGVNATAGWVFDGLAEPMRQVQVYLFSMGYWRFDGLHTSSLEGVNLTFGIWEHGQIGAEFGVSNPAWDDMETRGGPPVRRPVEAWGDLWLNSAQDRPVCFSLTLSGGASEHGQEISLSSELRWSPFRYFRIAMTGTYTRLADSLLWVGDRAVANGTEPLLGRLDLDSVELSLRTTLALTPALSIQAYLQMLATGGSYGEVVALTPSGLVPAGDEGLAEASDFDEVVLLTNLVLRWEARPGTVLYVVYTHSGSDESGVGLLNVGRGLGDAAWTHGSDLFLVKLELTFT
jgi:hypothetical protein